MKANRSILSLEHFFWMGDISLVTDHWVNEYYFSNLQSEFGLEIRSSYWWQCEVYVAFIVGQLKCVGLVV